MGSMSNGNSKSGTRKVFGVTYQTQKGDKTLTYFDEPLRKKHQPGPGLPRKGL